MPKETSNFTLTKVRTNGGSFITTIPQAIVRELNLEINQSLWAEADAEKRSITFTVVDSGKIKTLLNLPEASNAE